jgi:tetratricopeptide (TPR) repeat protein
MIMRIERVFVLALCLLLALPLAARAQEGDPAKHYDAGRKAEAARDFAVALAEYDKVLEIDEEYKDAFLRWDACVKLADWREAIEGEVGAMDLVRLGEVHLQVHNDNRDAAKELGEDLTAAEKEKLSGWLKELIATERACYEDAIEMDPACQEAHGHLALSHYVGGSGSMLVVIRETFLFMETSPHRDKLEQAIADFKVYGELRLLRAKLDDEWRAARNAERDPLKAASVLEGAAKTKKDLPDAFYTWLWASAGKCRMMKADNEGARKAFEEALKHAACTSTMRARLALASIDCKAGNLPAALEHLRAAVAEGSDACKTIALQRDKAYKPLFEAEDASIRDEVAKLADQEYGDAPIRESIDKAVEKAKAEGKKVLLHWYGPYCPYVMAMEERLVHPEVRKLIADHYVYVRIDFGSHHRADTLDAEYGGVMREHGVPCFTVLDAEGTVLNMQKDIPLFGAPHRDFDVKKIVAWLEQDAE